MIGKTIKVGKIKLKVNDLCRPCKNLQNRLGQNNIIKEFLKRGGLRCEILTSGFINVGDKIINLWIKKYFFLLQLYCLLSYPDMGL